MPQLCKAPPARWGSHGSNFRSKWKSLRRLGACCAVEKPQPVILVSSSLADHMKVPITSASHLPCGADRFVCIDWTLPRMHRESPLPGLTYVSGLAITAPDRRLLHGFEHEEEIESDGMTCRDVPTARSRMNLHIPHVILPLFIWPSYVRDSYHLAPSFFFLTSPTDCSHSPWLFLFPRSPPPCKTSKMRTAVIPHRIPMTSNSTWASISAWNC
jgi:hypothetical protein